LTKINKTLKAFLDFDFIKNQVVGDIGSHQFYFKMADKKIAQVCKMKRPRRNCTFSSF